MTTYVYKDPAKKFELDMTERPGSVRVTLTDKGVTTQVCTAKNLEGAFREVEALFKAAGKPVPPREDWKPL
ncbi:MAG: hypothetical protein RDU24_12345 [Humidesulfovibrio sp.]|uniref:hypothetical protein n=1 Tax=Humidesulfovibrio sp. TaxID=2910988 RepID=UPI0027F1499C|nr:hypothetical protein [Humidesulfovibrio sp.]MDQ7836164.1 hypothetical protein [Humidesulfovibrio sp.]